MTEHQKLMEMLSMYQKILHPDVFDPIIRQLHKAHTESKQTAFQEAKISPFAQWLDKEISIMNMLIRHTDKNFSIQCLVKKAINKYKELNPEQ